jgi:alcohol dehydrogenase (cytochrome c)
VALDAATGKVVWGPHVADERLGYRYTSGPIVGAGAIVAGMTGCERYKDDVCFISAHDPKTGASSGGRPPSPGQASPVARRGATCPLNRRSGADAWIPGSLRPGTGPRLLVHRPGQALGARVACTDGDALYSNSTLAIDPKTGKVAWHHQFIPGETHDMDEVFESVLVDRGGRRSLYKMGKLGILWQLDRSNGMFISSHDLGYQTLVDVNASTGRVAYRSSMLPKPGVELEFCPDINGVRGWHAMSYDPVNGALVIPIRPGCQTGVFFDKVEPKNVGDFSWYGNPALNGSKLGTVTRHPKMLDHGGELISMDVETGRVRWRVPMPAASSVSALTTAGGHCRERRPGP